MGREIPFAGPERSNKMPVTNREQVAVVGASANMRQAWVGPAGFRQV